MAGSAGLHVVEGIIGLVVFGFLSILCGFRFTKLIISTQRPLFRACKWYHLILGLFSTARFLWSFNMVVPLPHEDLVELVLNRVAFMLFLTSFSLMMFSWIDIFHRSFRKAQIKSKGNDIFFSIFVLFNIIMYVAQAVVLLMITTVDSQTREGHSLYEWNIYVLVGLFCAIAVGFLVYGLGLYVKMNRVQSESPYALRSTKRGGVRILVAGSLLTTCFLARVVMFLWRPLTGHYLPYMLFFLIAYVIPEAVPSYFEVVLLWNVERGNSKADLRMKNPDVGESLLSGESEMLEELGSPV